MSLEHYRLSSQLGSGPAGVRYRANFRDDGAEVELVILEGLSGDLARRSALGRRLRLARMVDHPSSRQIRAVEFESIPPLIALEWLDGATLAQSSDDEVDPLARVVALAQALAAGHRVGLIHGRISPDSVMIRPDGGLCLDWTGLETEDAKSSGSDHHQNTRFLAPELTRGAGPEVSADLYSLGAILEWEFERQASTDFQPSYEIRQLVEELLSDDPAARPSAKITSERLLASVSSSRVIHASSSVRVSETSVTAEFSGDGSPFQNEPRLNRERLGRFQLLEILGEGGMGTVYRGRDLADDSLVALKVLKSALASRPDSLRRFHKEARLLAEVSNSRVANLIEINEDDGVHYLALEYVDGINLAEWVRLYGPIDEREALAILADVARALESAHERGIVHRDIKPENILIVADADQKSASGKPEFARAKLSDFGLAKHVVESESLVMTRAGAIIGTPLYMAPEQCAGADEIGPTADVYAMGATLFFLLAGRPPFQGDFPLIVMAQHQNEPIPDLKRLVASVSDAVCSIVTKALAKRTEHRYASAGEMLVDLERLLRGEPTGLELHPKLPGGDTRDVVTFDWRWDLDASPRELWPVVSNTERFNRAIGLASVQFDNEPDPSGGSKTSGKFRKSGLEFAWREHPFEWVEGRRMGVVREFERGPFEWFVSVVELSPRSEGGTVLTHQVKIKPRGLVGRTIAAFEIGTRGRKGIDRVYRRIDAALTGKLGRDPTIDPFEPPQPLANEQRRRLESWLDKLGSKGFDPQVVERFGDFLELAPAQEVARIRPLAIARRLGVNADSLVNACFQGAADGVLMLLWDLLCPVCRIPSQVIGTLRALEDHGHCESCQLDFDLDFANSVEVIFRVHPEIRETDLKTYCAGSPSHSPHVAAQARVGPGERMVLDLSLETGSYRLRGPQLPYAIDFRVEPGTASKKWQVDLKAGPEVDFSRTLRAGGQVIELINPHDREILVRIERLAPRNDALTAARASSLAIFRELFPGEVLSPGQLINLDTVTLLVTEIDQAGDLYAELGDARAFGILMDQFRLVEKIVRQAGGALIKTVQEGSVSAFTDPSAAVSSALELLKALKAGEKTRELGVKIGIHRGSAMVATLNDHLDYFGTTVSVASQLPKLARAGQVVMSRAVASDPKVATLVKSLGLNAIVAEVELETLAERFVHILEPEGS